MDVKSTILAGFLLALTVPVWAQSNANESLQDRRAINDWLRTLAAQRAGIDPETKRFVGVQQPSDPPGVHIYDAANFPAPESVKKLLYQDSTSPERARPVAPEKVPTEAQARARLARWKKTPTEELAKSLTFVPAEISSTPLATGTLLDAGSTGSTLGHGISTGLTRTYDVPGMGLITLDEVDYPSSPSLSIMLVKEAFNTDVDGTPTIARRVRTTDGRGEATLRWITPKRSYTLTLITDKGDRLEQGQHMLKAIASQMEENG